MSSILRQLVAGPRLQHPEAGLDLCYVTDNIIATSGPSATYPQRAYRTPIEALVSFLDGKHGKNWCIWEFRGEGTGYPDSEVHGRIHHFPWPDHQPPPFALIPNIMGSMRDWLRGTDEKESNKKEERVIVVHCKAGKGRSGTVATGYLISHEGWKKDDALQRFTERRMRVGFGAGISILSQLRYIGYIDRWTNEMDKQYVERPVEILELHVFGLRDGVRAAVEGYVDQGRRVQGFHVFHHSECTVVERGSSMPIEQEDCGNGNRGEEVEKNAALPSSATWFPMPSNSGTSSSTSDISLSSTASPSRRASAVIFRPSKQVIVPSSDVNIAFERRSKASYRGLAMVTSVAHVWFNAYFEGGAQHDSGVFETEWEAMDGIKGSTKKGIRALDRLKVVWRYPPSSSTAMGINKSRTGKEAEDTSATITPGHPISEPKPGDPIPESSAADWRGQNAPHQQSIQTEESTHLPHVVPDQENQHLL